MSKQRACLTVVLSRISPSQEVQSLFGATVQFIPGRCVASRGTGKAFAAVQLSLFSEVQ